MVVEFPCISSGDINLIRSKFVQCDSDIPCNSYIPPDSGDFAEYARIVQCDSIYTALLVYMAARHILKQGKCILLGFIPVHQLFETRRFSSKKCQLVSSYSNSITQEM